jgi:hypothetical protein
VFGVAAGALALAFGLAGAEGGGQRPGAYRISAVQAKLFYDQSGTFSPDVLKGFRLWNAIIGEGDAREPSSATLVLVEVSGKPGAYEPSRKVEITAVRKGTGRRSRPSSVRKVVETGILSSKGRWVAPLWLDGTGCDPVTIRARLLGQGASASVTRTIEFQCGE